MPGVCNLISISLETNKNSRGFYTEQHDDIWVRLNKSEYGLEG